MSTSNVVQRYKESDISSVLSENKSALLVLPGFLLWAAFMVVPMFYLGVLSLTNATQSGSNSLYRGSGMILGILPIGSANFVGLENYMDLLFTKSAIQQGVIHAFMSDPLSVFEFAFWNSMIVTWLFVAVSVLGKVILGVGLSMVLTGNRVRGKRLFRGILIMPMGIPVIFSIVVWRAVFSSADYGLMNNLLLRAGLISHSIGWLQGRWLAFGTYVVTEMWLAYPFMMLITVSALQNVNGELLDAAKVDGAGWLARFWHVILPSIKRPVLFGTILTSAASFQQFLIPWIFNKGGPGTDPGKNALILVYAYREALVSPSDYALGGAISFVMLVFLGGFMYIAVRRGNLAEEAGET